jgi:hypothetical protein
MFRTLFGAVALVSLIVVSSQPARAQQLLQTKGFGTLSGKVTLDGDIPAVIDLVAAIKAKGVDLKCCLASGAVVTDQKWIVDKKTKGVANVVVWVKPPPGKYFDIPAKLQNRKGEKVVIDQPNCAFLPYVSAYNPSYFDGKKQVPTGQELIFKNSSTATHNVRALGDGKINVGFNPNLAPKTELNATKDLPERQQLKPYLMPVTLECSFHPWMTAKVYVFDHPFYAITGADGSYEIPSVPAGTEVILMVHHGDAGWVLTEKGEFKNGRPITVKAGEKKVMDFKVKAP